MFFQAGEKLFKYTEVVKITDAPTIYLDRFYTGCLKEPPNFVQAVRSQTVPREILIHCAILPLLASRTGSSKALKTQQ